MILHKWFDFLEEQVISYLTLNLWYRMEYTCFERNSSQHDLIIVGLGHNYWKHKFEQKINKSKKDEHLQKWRRESIPIESVKFSQTKQKQS